MTQKNGPLKQVLVADDDEDMMRLLEVTLTSNDRYVLLIAREGQEALRIAREKKPNVIFLDVMMPRMDGFEVCRALKQDPETKHIKIIMLTALAQERDQQKAAELGADGYMTKPFSPIKLMDRLDKLLAES